MSYKDFENEQMSPSERRRRDMIKARNTMIGGAALVIIFMFIAGFLFVSFDRVKPGYVGIIQNKINGEITVKDTLGYKFVNPFTSQFVEYPVSTEYLILTAGADEGSPSNDSLDTPSKEGPNVNVDVSVAYHVGDVEKLYKKYRGASIETIAHNVLRNTLNSDLMATTGTYSILDMNDKRDEIAGKVLTRMRTELAEVGLVIEGFNFRRITLPDSVKGSFEAKIAAENATKQATSAAAKTLIEAQMNLDNAKINAQAKQVAAEAEAKANETISASLTDKMLQLKSIEKFNDKVEVIYTPAGANLLLGGASATPAK